MLAVPLIDEIGSGVAPASAPDIARDVGVAPGLAAGAIVAAFHSLALVVETPLLAWADRGRVRTVSSVALAVLGIATVLAGVAPGPLVLIFALALYGPASGLALAASEGLLVESRPDERERTMARLTIAGAVGDLAVPAMLGLLGLVGLGWREASVAAGIAAIAIAVVHARSRELDRPMAMVDDDDDDSEKSGSDGEGEPRTPLRALFRILRSRPALLAWTMTGPGIALLDEVLVAFAVVHLDERTGATGLEKSIAVAACTIGGLVGLVLLERLATRVPPMRVLAFSVTLVVVSLSVLVFTRSSLVAIVALSFAGAGSATLHPIASARAYASLPGRPAIVSAASAIVAPLDVVLPLVLSAIALRHGSIAAMLALVVAPLAVGAAALAAVRADRRAVDHASHETPEK